MAHYRDIQIDGHSFKYVVGEHRTKIVKVEPGLTYTIGTWDNREIGDVYDERHIAVRPNHIEKTIRKEFGLPARQYDWDVPTKAKADPGPKTRGFREMIGTEVVDVQVSVNAVIIEGRNGERFSIEGIGLDGMMATVKCRQLLGDEAE